jgi:hypothetical protein
VNSASGSFLRSRLAPQWQALLAAVALGLSLPLQAAVITFDEFAADNVNGPMPANRYAALGITFVATDDGSTWGGIANGDLGNWGINGTNGPVFSGFNGVSSGLTTLFSVPVSGFALDVSRSNGSAAGQQFTLEGYLNNVLVDSVTVTLGGINTWSTVALNGVVDETRWIGSTGFNPYGVDNVRWNGGSVPDHGSSLLLLAGALAGLVGLHRRRKV